SPFLSRVPPPDDQPVGRLVMSGLLAFRRLAPRCHRMTAAGGTAFAAAVWMVDRVHRHASHRWAMTQPAVASGLAADDVLLIGIRDRADRRPTFGAHHAQLP